MSYEGMKRSSPRIHLYFIPGRYIASIDNDVERKDGVEHMANIITASMACFPYVMVGLGQAIIVGTHSTGRTAHDTAETTGRRIPLMTFEERVKTSGKEDTRCKVCFIPGCPVFTAR